MGKRVAFLSALSFYLLFSNPLSGQIFPIRGNLVLTPPYSPYISDYVGLQGGNLRLFMLAENANIVNYRIRFKMTIEGLTSGVKVKTSESFLPAPVYITGGVPLDLDGLDLSGYFLPANLDFASGDASLFNRTAQLPEGYYRICFQAFDYTRNIPVSNEACFSAWMMLNQAPLLNFPSQGSRISYLNPQNLLFQWTGMHLASPNAAGLNVEYVFSLVEVNPPGRNINDAIVNTRPLLETRTEQPFLLYDIGMPVLQAGKVYAWRVRAVDLSGRDLFVNNGYSETWSFIYGESCNLPTRIASEVLGESSARINYNADPYGEGYTLQYRVKGTQNDWAAKANGGAENKFLLEGLEADTEYEYRLRTDCKGLSGAWTNPYTFKTAAKGQGVSVCELPDKQISYANQTLVAGLEAGDFVMVKDNKMSLTTVEANPDGTFSGTGLMPLSIFGGASLKMVYKDIKVNTDRLFLGGSVYGFTDQDRKNALLASDDAEWREFLNRLGDDMEKDTLTDATMGGLEELVKLKDILLKELDETTREKTSLVFEELEERVKELKEARKTKDGENRKKIKSKIGEYIAGLVKGLKDGGGKKNEDNSDEVVRLKTGGFDPSDPIDLNVTFEVENVDAESLQIIQVFYGTEFITLDNELQKRGIPQNWFFIGGRQYFSFVDAGINSPTGGSLWYDYDHDMDGDIDEFDRNGLYGVASKYWKKRFGDYPVTAVFPNYPERPYFLGPNSDYNKEETNVVWDKGLKKGTISFLDYAGAIYAHEYSRFESIIVAKNYQNSGKDKALAYFEWGWDLDMKTINDDQPKIKDSIHKNIVILNKGISERARNIIKTDYPDYILYE